MQRERSLDSKLLLNARVVVPRYMRICLTLLSIILIYIHTTQHTQCMSLYLPHVIPSYSQVYIFMVCCARAREFIRKSWVYMRVLNRLIPIALCYSSSSSSSSSSEILCAGKTSKMIFLSFSLSARASLRRRQLKSRIHFYIHQRNNRRRGSISNTFLSI